LSVNRATIKPRRHHGYVIKHIRAALETGMVFDHRLCNRSAAGAGLPLIVMQQHEIIHVVHDLPGEHLEELQI